VRFVPDTWLDAALRPLYMLDPVNGMYVEIAAPDGRFAALLLLLLICWVVPGRNRGKPDALRPNQRWTLLGLALGFVIWTLASGNGRYFIWGLMVVGPLVVVAARRLPASQFLRNSAIIGVLLLQGLAIGLSFVPNVWTVRPWREGPGFALDDTPLSQQPAVFMTLGAISYSALVPQMHPDSRWSNISGQVVLQPGAREYPALLAMLRTPLPRYVVARATTLTLGPDGQPLPKVKHSFEGVISRHNLSLATGSCTYVRSGDAAKAFLRDPARAVEEGFWFCPVNWAGPVSTAKALAAVAPEHDATFAQVEQHCPRLFPPGYARTRRIDGALQRAYPISDTNLYVDDSGSVYFKNDRAVNPTTIGTIAQVRAGQFKMACDHIQGRYAPPWQRG
jgi:hypothetical protein